MPNLGVLQQLLPLKQPSATQRFKTLADARQMLQGEQINALKIQQAQQELQANQQNADSTAAIREIMVRHQGDFEKAKQEIYAIDPNVGAKMEEVFTNIRKSRQDLLKGEADIKNIESQITERNTPKPGAEFENVGGNLFNRITQQWMKPPQEPKADPNIGKTIETAKGIMQWNPETQAYDKPSGMPYEAPKAPAAPEPLVAIMKDGKPTLVPRSEAVNQTPASNREQGRPVVSGDANRIADFNTSLDDVDVLDAVVSAAGDTGTLAKIQASAPNWVTEITGGWGAEAKSRQAVIDRVKQVIGKALEGGVLRKEDEYKYEKILPTLGDVQSVVLSKMKDLAAAITQRRETLVDALEDAGYDVEGFRKRHATRGNKQGGLSVTAGGKTYTFPDQQSLDAFKREAGIP